MNDRMWTAADQLRMEKLERLARQMAEQLRQADEAARGTAIRITELERAFTRKPSQ